MAKIYKRSRTNIFLSDFLDKAKKIKHFSSSRGKRYEVSFIVGDILKIIRLDADNSITWDIDLKMLYKAYEELNDFKTESFRPYVPIAHSPSRGLLIHLGLLE